jgi:hypothetical protein
VEGEEECEVECTEQSRMFRSQLQYLMIWKGYKEKNQEHAANVASIQAIDKFHSEYHGKPASETLLELGVWMGRLL